MKQILRYVAVACLLAFTSWLTWLFIDNFRVADAGIKASLIGLFGVISAALVTHYQTKKREINARHFSDKREAYMHMIDLLFELLLSTKKNEKLPEEKMIEKMTQFKKALIVWGGPQIIEAWNRFEIESNDGPSSEKMIHDMEKILRAIRKDLGHDDGMLKFGSLWGLLLVAKDKKLLLGEE